MQRRQPRQPRRLMWTLLLRSVLAWLSADIMLVFELTGDFELLSEPIMVVSMSFYSKRAIISIVFIKVPLARCARASVESCSMRSSIS